MLQYLDELERKSHIDRDTLLALQTGKLRKLIQDALTHSPYFRETFRQCGLRDARDIQSVEDLSNLPVLSKSVVRERLSEITWSRPDLVKYQTGGSTGIPISFYANHGFLHYEKEAATYHAYGFAGYRIGHPMGIIWGYDRDLPTRGVIANWVQKRIYHHVELNSFNLSDADVRDFVERARTARLRFIKGYASSLLEVAERMNKMGISFATPPIAVFSEAERLDSVMRSRIEQLWKTRLFDLYGSREFGTIACECEAHDGLHVNADQLIVELNAEGHLLVTSLNNRGTFFIRYDIGDTASGLESAICQCGRASYRLKRVTGRTSDHFVATDGSVVHGEYFTHLFYETKAIKQFQIVQKSRRQIDINVVTDDRRKAEPELTLIMQKMDERLKGKMEYRLSFVSEIEKTRTGKFKFTISHLTR